MLKLSEPKIIERGPYKVVGAYCTFEGEDEGPGWSGAHKKFSERRQQISNRKGDTVLGFLYRPHRDDPDIPESVRSCFIGVEVTDFGHVPEGLSTTRFSGGKYVVVACQGDTEGEAAMGVGEGVDFLEKWMSKQGYVEGDACFACSHEQAEKPLDFRQFRRFEPEQLKISRPDSHTLACQASSHRHGGARDIE
jgi:predicted transcriptional regulator YdeE